MKAALPLTALISAAIAFDGRYGTNGSPGNMSEQEWQSAFEKPNATGTYKFEAYNVSERFPPNKTVDGWRATIRVANITDDPEDDTPYPGIDISVQAPEGMRVPTLNSSRTNSSDWYVCVAFWGPSRLKDGATDDAQHDDGDCSSFLDEDCLKALNAEAAGYYWNGEECTMLPHMPVKCEKYYKDYGPTYGGAPGANLSQFEKGKTLISQRPQTVGRYNAMTQEEAYDYAVRGVWTVMINWGRRDPDTYSLDDVLQPSLLCLRTRNITRGSEDPNAGTRTTGYVPMAVFSALMASLLLVY
ncbi:uncharacterized protein BKA55DRAFT_685732 [Fusarium redolens]|uniref:Uncharacterized protein n=1 Tax=Fusarium redolens TaxID=48865 RepID=A0A9P9HXN0_FUSRE|nr:uncharacterized protein BKA55DRAFT_685732 [Fusarium redolens]KAH7265261.1 hypothetical protein BKA55DRAFT_685732 [Fusarium redolens]